jgi:hypothetical protein
MNRAALSWTAGALLFAFGIIRIAHVLPARSHENDFAHYYVTSRLWLEGKDPYRTPFAPEFAMYGFKYDPRIPSGGNAPPPVAAFAPFALLTPRAAFVIWTAVQALSLIVTLMMIGSLFKDRIPRRMLPLFLGLLMASSAVYFHFFYSQVQLLVGALLLAGYMLHRSGRYPMAPVLVSAAALLKLFPATILPWFVLTSPGDWKSRATRMLPACGFVLLTALSIVNLGWAAFGLKPGASAAAEIWRVAYIGGGILVGAAYLTYRRYSLETGFCLQLLAMMLASPTAWAITTCSRSFPSRFSARGCSIRSAPGACWPSPPYTALP